MPTIFAARSSSVTIDEKGAIDGLQSITYKLIKNREDVAAVGSDERIDVSFGLKIVEGTLKVKSTNKALDDLLADNFPFQINAELKKELGLTGQSRKVTFNQCFLDNKVFGMDANGVAVTTYFFTATSVEEKEA